MPKDLTINRELLIDDRVDIPCRITAIAGNVLTLKTLNPRGTETVLTVNANQVIKD